MLEKNLCKALLIEKEVSMLKKSFYAVFVQRMQNNQTAINFTIKQCSNTAKYIKKVLHAAEVQFRSSVVQTF